MAVPFNAIAEGLGDIFGVLNYISGMLNPLSPNFIMKVAFVPSEDFEMQFWEEIHAVFNLKVPLIGQLKDFFQDISEVSTGAATPVFEVTFNGKYGNGTYSIIDFEYFDDYRVYILNFIRFAAWFMFLKSTYRRLPSMLY